MYIQNIDTKLQKKVQSKEFEESVDQAVRSFMYELDFMLLEEQHTTSSLNYSSIQPDAASSGLTRIENFLWIAIPLHRTILHSGLLRTKGDGITLFLHRT
ncbi:MAG: hypothetical protein Ct9H300mP21_05600 [Pseudomonadota bacterium]|nr:MAG: hypothetical protein Ct9H300mP21_05600 [Pseudomonadota bacterium]